MKHITIPIFLFYTLIIGIFAILVIFMFAMNDGNQCLNNPLVYGAKKATTPETGGVKCSCGFLNPKYEPFYFDADGISLETNLYSGADVDISDFKP